jgi:ribonuclease P protein subunit POP4
MAQQPSHRPNIGEELLQRAHSDPEASTIFLERVKQRPLLLRPSSPTPAQDARARRQHERLQKERAQRKSKKPKPLSAKQKRTLRIYEIPKSQQKYSIYEPLHEMWCGYVREILGLSGDASKTGGSRAFVDATSAGPILASADFHGARLEVVRSRCASSVGVKGIVVKDTKFTFELITKGDALKTMPKEHTVFRFELPFQSVEEDVATMKRPLIFEIYGSQFETRAPDRANKKFRLHLDKDL